VILRLESLPCEKWGSSIVAEFRAGKSTVRNAYSRDRSYASRLKEDRDDPLTEMIAKQIIKIAQAGVHDVAQLSALAVAELRIR
jgi:hypothetical protein